MGDPTEDEGDHKGLYVLCAGLVGITGEIGNVQAKRCVVSKDAVEICRKRLVASS